MTQKPQIFGEPERESTFFLDDPPKQSATQTDNKKSSKSDSKSKKSGKKSNKDAQEQDTISKKAEKMAEDPFATESEMRNIDGSSKEKQQKAEESDGQDSSSSDESKEKTPEQELSIMASRADKILLHAKAMFPFDLFGSTITIDANKVNIRIKTFFLTETVTSVMLKEIMDVRVHASLIFGQLMIDYGPHPLKVSTVYISHLRKKEALKAKEIIEGILVLYRGENIDTSKLKPEEAMEEIKEVGKVEERE